MHLAEAHSDAEHHVEDREAVLVDVELPGEDRVLVGAPLEEEEALVVGVAEVGASECIIWLTKTDHGLMRRSG